MITARELRAQDRAEYAREREERDQERAALWVAARLAREAERRERERLRQTREYRAAREAARKAAWAAQTEARRVIARQRQEAVEARQRALLSVLAGNRGADG